MDYKDFKILCQRAGLTMKHISNTLNYSAKGLQMAMDEGTFPISKLPKLFEMLDIDANEFFNMPPKVVNNTGILGGVGQQNNNQAADATTIQILREQLAIKDKQINTLTKLVGDLHEHIKQLNNQKSN